VVRIDGAVRMREPLSRDVPAGSEQA
jgi:hypothetical protein